MKRAAQKHKAMADLEEAKETGKVAKFKHTTGLVFSLTITKRRSSSEIHLHAIFSPPFCLTGTVEEIERFSKRLVRANQQHTEDCKTLLRLMGVPVLDVSNLTALILVLDDARKRI